MPKRPITAFALSPERTLHIFTEEHHRYLAELCDIPDATPLQEYDSARATAVLAKAEILITGWGYRTIDGKILAQAPNLRLIAHAAGSVKTLIAPEVYAAGVRVTQGADANAIPVAEFTLAAILFANKRVLRFAQLYAADRTRTHWQMPLGDEPIGNYRKKIGIVGASRIGRRVMELLRPLDLDVLLYDPYVSDAGARDLGATLLDLDELIARSDVLSLHAPAIEATRNMIDARRLALLPDGATLINTARGQLLDQIALEAELVSGRIDAIIDVTDPEVPHPSCRLYDLPNVLLTPHIAGALGVERSRIGTLIVEEIERYIRGEPLQHLIDPKQLPQLA